MSDDEAGGSGSTASAPSKGDLKYLIKESIRELIHEDPALLDSGGRRRDSARPPEEGNSPLCTVI